MKRLSPTRLAALLALCAGCGGEPRVRTNGTVAGEYVLVERNGGRLPHTMTVPFQGQRCTVTLVRLVMTLRADGTFFEDGQGRTRCLVQTDSGPVPDTSHTFRGAGRYELRGPRGDTLVMFDSIVPDNPPQTGVFVRDELRMILPLAPPLDTVHFRYVRQRTRE